MKDTLHRKAKSNIRNQFFIGNRSVTNPDKIANEFKEHFVNIRRLLFEQITSSDTSKDYLGDKSIVLFIFTPLNECCIDNIVNKLKSKSSYGYDKISNNLLKYANSNLIKPLN